MKLLWTDLETTGLDPAADQILEVAMSVADLLRPFEIERSYHAVLHYSGLGSDALHPRVVEMHTKNGLFAECARSVVYLRDVDRALWLLLAPCLDDAEQPVLAGASIHFDHGFIDRKLPMTAALLSHRHYDVSSVKLFARSFGMPALPRADAHRARADVEETMEQARSCARWLKERAPA